MDATVRRRAALVWLAAYEKNTGARHADVLFVRRQIMAMNERQLERFLGWLESRGIALDRTDPFAHLATRAGLADTEPRRPAPFTAPGRKPKGKVRFSFPARVH